MILDQPEKFTQVDKNKVLESVQAFQSQCMQAWEESSVIAFDDRYKNIKNVVVCGMGGSRFTPRAIKELYKNKIKVPYEINDDYDLPGYVDTNTLVILSSYSGTTEEVLSCGQHALGKEAKITAVAMGGAVKDFMDQNGRTGYFFNPAHNPSGQPRIGSGYMLFGHLGVLFALGLLDINKEDVSGAIAKIAEFQKQYEPSVPLASNPAKNLAATLVDKHPFIITAEFLKGFGNGFANQINETAKNISDPRNISELNHHLLEGLRYPETLHQNGLFVLFNSVFYSDPVQKRFKITKDVAEKNGLKTLEISLTGTSTLTQLLEAFTLSGFTTYYMAMLKDLDPVAIPWVDYFKEQLKK